MTEPSNHEIAAALNAIEQASTEPMTEREKAYWIEAEASMRTRYQEERVRRRILEIAVANLQGDIKARDAAIGALRAQRDLARELAKTWRFSGLLLAVLALCLGLAIGGWLR